MSAQSEQKELQKIRPQRVVYPILIGFSVIAYLFYKEFDPAVFRYGNIHFTDKAIFWLMLAFFCIIIRDVFYIIRLRVFSNNELNLRQAFRITMLWEFTSSITPAAFGGTTLAVVFIHKEGVSIGRSSTIIMLTALLDELYFVLMFPLLLLFIGPGELFHIIGSAAWSYGIYTAVIIGYVLKLLWFLTICFGLFISPRGFGKLIYRLFHLPFLKRWKRGAGQTAIDLIKASKEIRLKKFSFWWKTFLSTFIAWTSRYWIVNFLLLSFFFTDSHFLIFARQVVMYIVLMVSPTPGGSGIAEMMFNQYLGEFIPVAGFAVVLALFWRLITYYPYLIIGFVLFVKWVNRKF
ncbi:MAG: flippase-like domain-containing protein [Candidatus Symbiothrix sp.]|jgi:uncharacterized protein (TIRG00374 family)|nr:flippase-like domain-containing protein [Candidatus Symbiothrix sp.]